MGADELFGGYRKHLACLMASRYRRLPARCAPGRRAARGGPAAGERRRPRPALRALGQALPDLRRARRRRPRSGAATRCTTRTSWPGCSSPDLARPGRPGRRRAPRDLQRQRPGRTRSTGCAWPTRGCSCPASTSPTPTGPAWRRRSRCACRSSTRWWLEAAFSHPGPRQDPRRGQGKARAQGGRASTGCPHEIVYRPKASFSAPLRAWVQQRPARRSSTTCSSTASSSSPG